MRQMGNRSPILPNTEAQARALEQALGGETKAFIAMRYWHPMTAETVAAVKAYAPDQVILLPLYPQFSTTTTASSYQLWCEEAARQGLTAPQRLVCCWPTERGIRRRRAPTLVQSGPGARAGRARRHAKPLIVLLRPWPAEEDRDDGDPYVLAGGSRRCRDRRAARPSQRATG